MRPRQRGNAKDDFKCPKIKSGIWMKCNFSVVRQRLIKIREGMGEYRAAAAAVS
jgi:hypothetical protein